MTPDRFGKARSLIAAECRYDPLMFAEVAWPWGEGHLKDRDIRAWQSEVLDEIAKHLKDPATRHSVMRIAVASGHGIGKSALTGMLTSWALSCWRDPRIVITANTETQLLTKTSPEVGSWIRSSLFGDLFQIDAMSIRYKARPEQHRADLITNSESNPEAFAGLHAEGRLVLVIVDEASALPENIYETILGALTDENTVLIFVLMGNPTSAYGAFREAFRKNRKFWTTWNIDSRDVEGTSKEFLNQIIEEFGEHSDQAKVRVKGIFPAASQKQFIPTPYIDASYGRHLRKEQYEFAPKILSCDPAWEGDDLLVIGMRQGLKFDILEVLEKNDNDVFIAAKLANYEDSLECDAVFVDAGYGTGIASAGKTMGRSWTLVWFGSAPETPGYRNKRAEMYGKAKQWLMDGGAIPRIQRLYDDLVSVETKPDNGGIIQLISKQEMKKKKLPSTDYADALALTFAYEVSSKATILKAETVSRQSSRRRDSRADEVFDPYED